jgi:hypothetical protein
MKSAALGQSTSPAEVTNVSPHGFWLIIDERELFVAFQQFPWFRDAPIRAITNVQLPSPHHLYWPDLDIDFAVESIEHPEKYPLVSQALTRKTTPSTSRAPLRSKVRRASRATRE